MRLPAAIFTALALSPSALAHAQSSLAVPPAPAIVSAPLAAPGAPAPPSAPAPPPGLVQTPFPPAPDASAPPPDNTGTTDAGVPNADSPAAANTPAPGLAAPDTSPDTPPAIPNTWLPGRTATLGVLDKVDGSTTQLVIPVGGQANAGDLQVSVQSCVSRPPDQLPDIAVYLAVQNTSAQNTSANAVPLYRGWVVRSTPGATVVGDGSVSFRVIDCS